MTAPDDPFAARADRILDAAGELLLRHGYRKVTIEDIARRARIGKGTVYLHWRTKDEVFVALLAREGIAMIEEIVKHLDADPENVLPHRLMRAVYLIVTGRPLLMAAATSDSEILGRMVESDVNEYGVASSQQFIDVAIEYGLFRDDIPDLAYTLSAATSGFYIANPKTVGIDPGTEARADALAHVVRTAFEPARTPRRSVLIGAAGAIREIFADIIPPYRAWIYRGKDDQ